jgi:cyclopropane fatty-acyl-phospholipid synthase-like methyltransferase
MKQSPDDVTQFHSVAHTTNPVCFAQFMDTSHTQPTEQSYKQEIMEQLAVQKGATILDVGCGVWRICVRPPLDSIPPRCTGGRSARSC